MTALIKVKHRFYFRNGDYLVVITDNKISSIFENSDVAKSTFAAMKNNPDLHAEFDEKNTIIQTIPDKTEAELLEIAKGELDSAINAKSFMHKISYEIVANK